MKISDRRMDHFLREIGSCFRILFFLIGLLLFGCRVPSEQNLPDLEMTGSLDLEATQYNTYLQTHQAGLREFLYTPITEEGVPIIILVVLPKIFEEYFGRPEEQFSRFGFYPQKGRVLPLGFGSAPVSIPLPIIGPILPKLESAFVTCAACHVGAVKFENNKEQLLIGSPNTTFNLRQFDRAMVNAVSDPKWNAKNFRKAIDELEDGFFQMGGAYETWNRLFVKMSATAILNKLKAKILLREARTQKYLIDLAYKENTRDEKKLENDEKKELDHERRLANTSNQYNFQSMGQMDLISRTLISHLEEVPVFPQEHLGDVIEKLDGSSTIKKYLPPRPAIVDIHSVLWYQQERDDGLWDGTMRDRDIRNFASLEKGTATPLSKTLATDMTEFLGRLPPPPYPFKIEFDKLERGSKIYEDHCQECHSPTIKKYETLEKLGVDPNRVDAINEKIAEEIEGIATKACQNVQLKSNCEDLIQWTGAYLTPPLYGVWSTSPYLHNGSVPTLQDLLSPPKDRPEYFCRGSRRYDTKNVGFYSGNFKTKQGLKECFKHGLSGYDTTLPGNSNNGHIYPENPLGEKDVNALLEYLKTL